MGRHSLLPCYGRHAPSGQARVVINGRTHYLGTFNSPSSRAKYDQLMAEFLSSGRSETFGLNASLSVGGLALRYLHYCENYFPKQANSRTSETSHVKAILRVVVKLYESTDVNEFGVEQFKTIRDQLLTDPNCQRIKPLEDPKPLSRNHINAQMKRLARMFRWGAGEGIVHPDVYAALRLVPSLKRGRTIAKETDRVLPVDDVHVDAVLPFVGPVVSAMIRLQRLTGCRPGEVCKLTPAMIDRSGEVWIVKLDEHKTAHHGREREIYLGPKAQEVVRPFLDRGRDKPLFSPKDSEKARREALTAARKTRNSCGNVVGSNRRRRPRKQPGDRYDTNSYRRAIHYGCDKAKIPRWSPNRIRHAAGTDVRKRFGLEAAQVILGHSKADVTQVYAEVDRERAVEIAKVVG